MTSLGDHARLSLTWTSGQVEQMENVTPFIGLVKEQAESGDPIFEN